MTEPNYPEDATPLDPNDIEGLIPTHITTRSELDRWEQDNINEALTWIEGRKPKDVLSESFMKLLHRKMFCNVWKWAGQFRRTEKNIGAPWYRIPIDLKQLCNDVGYWMENRTFSEDEIGTRFHHRLVSIHPFPNGNGRHARLIADILLENVLGKPTFTWGNANLIYAGDDRKRYIEALIAADRGEYKDLLKFVRS
ncbi:MAG TPA: mobile mystery protein B [Sedimentisphaerales bacterium]|nr:mobile mystery protein B [Sedimentisphaerales bacterium]